MNTLSFTGILLGNYELNQFAQSEHAAMHLICAWPQSLERQNAPLCADQSLSFLTSHALILHN